jgi:hypothetical protein
LALSLIEAVPLVKPLSLVTALSLVKALSLVTALSLVEPSYGVGVDPAFKNQ